MSATMTLLAMTALLAIVAINTGPSATKPLPTYARGFLWIGTCLLAAASVMYLLGGR